MSELLHSVIQHHLVNTLGWQALRPLQASAAAPVRSGADCLLLAPTAGGKTEAAVFPLLTRMALEAWTGTSVLYICPLRALLNNLHPRLTSYTGWLGRTAQLWHGDVGQADRRRILLDRPDILLTTPESLEAMLVSTKVDSREAFADLRAGVVAAEAAGPTETEVTLDHVGTLDNAASVISSLHGGEKRLVFVDSRRRAEELGAALRTRGVETYLSHSSLSATERARSEAAFAEARDCVVVATSTLELGIDVGDLDPSRHCRPRRAA